MSTWNCRIQNSEVGPLSFDDLVELVRAGKVGPGDLVCRSGGMGQWQAAREVIGLFRAAARPRGPAGLHPDGTDSAVAPNAPGAVAQPADGGGGTQATGLRAGNRRATEAIRRGAPQRARAMLIAGIMAIMVLTVVGWQLGQPERFPAKPSSVSPRTYNFPVVGEVSGFAMFLLCGDVVAVAGIAGKLGIRLFVPRRRKE